MTVGDPVRFYEGEWFSEGSVIAIESDRVVVDFLDWKQRYRFDELQLSYIHFEPVFVTTGPGELIEDFRN